MSKRSYPVESYVRIHQSACSGLPAARGEPAGCSRALYHGRTT